MAGCDLFEEPGCDSYCDLIKELGCDSYEKPDCDALEGSGGAIEKFGCDALEDSGCTMLEKFAFCVFESGAERSKFRRAGISSLDTNGATYGTILRENILNIVYYNCMLDKQNNMYDMHFLESCWPALN